MDYLFFSSLSMVWWLWLVMSYDIVCQWHVHLWERMSQFAEHFRFDLNDKEVTFLIPKFNLPAHVASCQTAFSFNLTPGVGRTDGEAPERGWSGINPISSQTKYMGPASRRDTIDDHFGDWNHKKVIGFGMWYGLELYLRPLMIHKCDSGASLLCKLKEAVPERADHVWDFLQFSDSLPATSVLEWTTIVKKWEENNSETNPFITTAPSK
jgi:hypothetical protein